MNLREGADIETKAGLSQEVSSSQGPNSFRKNKTLDKHYTVLTWVGKLELFCSFFFGCLSVY